MDSSNYKKVRTFKNEKLVTSKTIQHSSTLNPSTSQHNPSTSKHLLSTTNDMPSTSKLEDSTTKMKLTQTPILEKVTHNYFTNPLDL